MTQIDVERRRQSPGPPQKILRTRRRGIAHMFHPGDGLESAHQHAGADTGPVARLR